MLDAVHHLTRLLDDMIHEHIAPEFALLHLPQLVFPVAGQFG